MKTSYDPAVDALYIRLVEIAIESSQEVAPNVILDFDAEGRVVGLELLHASRTAAPGLLPQAAE